MNYTYFMKGDYITGWSAGGDRSEPLPEMNLFGALQDEYGNYKYQLIDGKIILNPQKPTAEQIEAKRKRLIIEEIRKKYSIDDELAILFRGTPKEKQEHEMFIEDCKDKAGEAT